MTEVSGKQAPSASPMETFSTARELMPLYPTERISEDYLEKFMKFKQLRVC